MCPRSASDSAAHIPVAERAYVKMSHKSPGANFDPLKQTLSISIEVRNSGRTPAAVTKVFFAPVILPTDEALPSLPQYETLPQPSSSATGYLHSGDHFYANATFPLPGSRILGVSSGKLMLYVVGYIDVFGGHHRGGYARVYDPALETGPVGKRNNLAFVTDRAYNYDRPRRKGEGDDWD